MTEFKDAFKGKGFLKESEVVLEVDENVKPVTDPQRRVPINVRQELKKHLDELVKLNIIKKVHNYTPWTNSIVIAGKKYKSICLCLDPRNLNKAIKRPVHCLLDVDFIRSELKNSKYFTTLDINCGFWNLKIRLSKIELRQENP